MLLKVILPPTAAASSAVSRIKAVCRGNVLFIAVSGDSEPNFTTLAAFVSELGDLPRCSAKCSLLCDRHGLIGREMFTIKELLIKSAIPAVQRCAAKISDLPSLIL